MVIDTVGTAAAHQLLEEAGRLTRSLAQEVVDEFGWVGCRMVTDGYGFRLGNCSMEDILGADVVGLCCQCRN